MLSCSFSSPGSISNCSSFHLSGPSLVDFVLFPGLIGVLGGEDQGKRVYSTLSIIFIFGSYFCWIIGWLFFFFQISKDFALLSLHHSDDKSAVKTFFFLYVHHSFSFSCCFYYLSLFKQIVYDMILVFVLVLKFVSILQFMSYNFHHIWKTFTYFFQILFYSLLIFSYTINTNNRLYKVVQMLPDAFFFYFYMFYFGYFLLLICTFTKLFYCV